MSLKKQGAGFQKLPRWSYNTGYDFQYIGSTRISPCRLDPYRKRERILSKVGDKIENLDQLEKLMLFDTGEEGIGKIYLSDVAEVSKVDNSEDTYAKVNGNDAVMLTFQKQSNFSTAEVADSIRKKSQELSLEYEGLSITTLMDQGIYIDIVVDSVLDNVIYGGILAILVLLLFLKDIRPTIVIAVSIPISLVLP